MTCLSQLHSICTSLLKMIIILKCVPGHERSLEFHRFTDPDWWQFTQATSSGSTNELPGCALMWHQIILFWNLKPSEASTPGMKDPNVYLLLLVCCNADPGYLIPANEDGRQTEGPPGFTQVKLDFISFIYCRLSQDHSRSFTCSCV